MATSLDDLLTAIYATARTGTGSDDAAEALRWSARLLGRLREDGGLLLTDPLRDLAARRLEDACRYAATSFPGEAGGASELVAVTHDVVGRLRDQLSHDDRWVITTNLAMATRRFAGTIARSGPYASVPELPSVAECAREVLYLAAARPVQLDRLRGLDLPIPSPQPIDTGSVIAAAAELVGELGRTGREVLTMREVTAACHAAYQLAAYTAIGARPHGTDVAFPAHQLARSWNDVREIVALYADASPQTGATSVLGRAIRLDEAVRHALSSGTDTLRLDDANLRLTSRYLGRLAATCHRETVGLGSKLVVPHGLKPLSEEHVAIWLKRQSIVVTDADLHPALIAFERAQCRATVLNRVLTPDRDRVTPGFGVKPRELSRTMPRQTRVCCTDR